MTQIGVEIISAEDREAVESLGKKRPRRNDRTEKPSDRSYVTNHVTKAPADELPCLQVIASTMGATGIEPMTSTVSR
jgi:hypothetical protein